MSSNQLGKETRYDSLYNSKLLYPIPRCDARKQLGVDQKPPFSGHDVWNAYELSWLNDKGKPQVGHLEFKVPCESKYIVESKSLKLYLNSFNFYKLSSLKRCEEIIKADLEACLSAEVELSINPLKNSLKHRQLSGINLDNVNVSVQEYSINKALLKNESQDVVSEQLYTQLFRSNCPVTNQPDWASLQLTYTGPKINHESLLLYIISYRNHQGFHENCIESMLVQITQQCKPKILDIQGFFLPRGGIDINPYRSFNVISE